MTLSSIFSRRSTNSRIERPTTSVETNRRSISAIFGGSKMSQILNPKSKPQIYVPQSSVISDIFSSDGKNRDSLKFSRLSQRRSAALSSLSKYRPTVSNYSTHGRVLGDVKQLIEKFDKLDISEILGMSNAQLLGENDDFDTGESKKLVKKPQTSSSGKFFSVATSSCCDINTDLIDDIESIVAFCGQPGVLSTFHQQTIQHLMNIVEKYTLRTITDIPKHLIYGDSYSPLFTTNWKFLNYFHKLLAVLIFNADQNTMDNWIDKHFLTRLVDLFKSPDPNEQNSALFLVQQIFETFENKQSLIFNAILNLVNSYIDGLTSFVCMQPALSFFIDFFSQNAMAFVQSYKQLFRTVFFRLFSTNFVNEYYKLLNTLIQIFYSNDPSLALWALNYLLKHWPLSNSAKFVIYIHQITVLSPFLNISETEKMIIQMFKQIGNALTSPNFKIALAALNVCCDENFIFLFRPLFPSIIPPLLKQISLLTDHWSPEVKNKMKDAFQVIYNIESKLSSRSHNSDSAETIRSKWMTVYNSALLSDTSLTTDLLQKKIMLIE